MLKSMGHQRVGRGGTTDPRFKQFPKSRQSVLSSNNYLMWDESLMNKDHMYAEQLAAVSRRTQIQAIKNLHAMTSNLKK